MCSTGSLFVQLKYFPPHIMPKQIHWYLKSSKFVLNKMSYPIWIAVPFCWRTNKKIVSVTTLIKANKTRHNKGRICGPLAGSFTLLIIVFVHLNYFPPKYYAKKNFKRFQNQVNLVLLNFLSHPNCCASRTITTKKIKYIYRYLYICLI